MLSPGDRRPCRPSGRARCRAAPPGRSPPTRARRTAAPRAWRGARTVSRTAASSSAGDLARRRAARLARASRASFRATARSRFERDSAMSAAIGERHGEQQRAPATASARAADEIELRCRLHAPARPGERELAVARRASVRKASCRCGSNPSWAQTITRVQGSDRREERAFALDDARAATSRQPLLGAAAADRRPTCRAG